MVQPTSDGQRTPQPTPPAAPPSTPHPGDPFAAAPHPGAPFAAAPQPTPQQFLPPAPQQPPVGVLSILTLVLSFFLGFVSVVLGVVALRQNWKNGTRGSVMAWIGICIGAVVGVLWTAFFMIGFSVAAAGA